MVGQQETTTFFEKMGIAPVPPTLYLLEQAPAQREPILNSGRWIVLVAAVWSGPDRVAVAIASRKAANLNADFNFGIRLFDYYEELNAWCPESKAARSKFYTPPLGISLCDGSLVRERCCLVSEEALSTWFAEAFQAESVQESRHRGVTGWIHSWFGRPQKAAEEKT